MSSGGDGEVGRDGRGAGIARGDVDAVRRIVGGEGQGECVLPAAAADDQQSHTAPLRAGVVERVAGAVGRPLRRSFQLVGELAELALVVRGGFAHVVPQRPVVGFAAAPHVFAADDPLVGAGLHPLLHLARPHHIHRMGDDQRVEHLVDHIEPVMLRGILVGLLHERFEVEVARAHVRRVGAARHLHEHPHRRGQVLRAEQLGAVGREFRLARPFQERQPDRQHHQLERQRQHAER